MKNYTIKKMSSPIIATALHDGHLIPEHLAGLMNLSEFERMREEDPYTAQFIQNLETNQIIVHTSRFYVDLNRTWHKALYLKQEDAWGLQVWKTPLSKSQVDNIKSYYDQFYDDLKSLIESCIQTFGYFIILDVHSYNHRRHAPHIEEPADGNPEINIGTKYNAAKWKMASESFMAFLRSQYINGQHPDVRENVKFKGGGMSQWINDRYSGSGCVLSVEFKKTFMDEWTGRAHIDHIQEINMVLKSTSLFLLGMMQSIEHQK